MQIENPNIWYVRWFLFSCRMIDRFWSVRTSQKYESKYADGTSLCHFPWIILHGSILVLLTCSLYVLGIAALIVVPCIEFSPGVVVGVTIQGVDFLLYYAFLGSLFVAAALAVLAAGIWTYETCVHDKKDPTFLSLMWQSVVAFKQRICPLVTWRAPHDA